MKQKLIKSKFKEGPPGVGFKNGKLYEFSKRHILVLNPWPDPRSWLKRRSHDWKSNRKHADLFLSNALFAPGTENTLPKRPLPPPIDEHMAARMNSEEWIAKQKRGEEIELRHRKIMAAYFDLIPPEVRTELLRYHARKWHLLNVFARCPGSMDLSRSNPALVFALASNWVFHKPAVKNPLRATRTLVNEKQRDILKWLRFPPNEPVRRILSRIAPETVSIGNLLLLRRSLRQKKTVKTLAHVRRINTGVIRLLSEHDGREFITPHLLNDVGQDREQDARFPPVLTIFRDTLRMLRAVDDPADQPPAFSSLRRLNAIHDQRARDFGDDLDTIAHLRPLPKAFPKPPFQGTETIVPIRTPAELRKEADEMHNCVFSYVNRVAEGQEYIYKVLAPVRASLSVIRRDKTWGAGQLVEFANKTVSDEPRHQVYRTLFTSPRNETATPGDNQPDPAAHTSLGMIYMQGQGVEKDIKEAIRYFRLAADHGHAPAQNILGMIFSNGRYTQPVDEEALTWFRLAAEQGDAAAENNLGWMIEHGRGCPQNDTEATQWYKKASANRNPRGQLHYGLMIREGRGTLKAPNVAARWIRKAAEQQDAEAQYELARLLETGQGVRKNHKQALHWYQTAAKQGYPAAKTRLLSLTEKTT